MGRNPAAQNLCSRSPTCATADRYILVHLTSCGTPASHPDVMGMVFASAHAARFQQRRCGSVMLEGIGAVQAHERNAKTFIVLAIFPDVLQMRKEVISRCGGSWEALPAPAQGCHL